MNTGIKVLLGGAGLITAGGVAYFIVSSKGKNKVDWRDTVILQKAFLPGAGGMGELTNFVNDSYNPDINSLWMWRGRAPYERIYLAITGKSDEPSHGPWELDMYASTNPSTTWIPVDISNYDWWVDIATFFGTGPPDKYTIDPEGWKKDQEEWKKEETERRKDKYGGPLKVPPDPGEVSLDGGRTSDEVNTIVTNWLDDVIEWAATFRNDRLSGLNVSINFFTQEPPPGSHQKYVVLTKMKGQIPSYPYHISSNYPSYDEMVKAAKYLTSDIPSKVVKMYNEFFGYDVPVPSPIDIATIPYVLQAGAADEIVNWVQQATAFGRAPDNKEWNVHLSGTVASVTKESFRDSYPASEASKLDLVQKWEYYHKSQQQQKPYDGNTNSNPIYPPPPPPPSGDTSGVGTDGGTGSIGGISGGGVIGMGTKISKTLGNCYGLSTEDDYENNMVML